MHVVHITADSRAAEGTVAQGAARKLVQLCDRLIVLWGPSRLGTRAAVELAERAGKSVEILGPERAE